MSIEVLTVLLAKSCELLGALVVGMYVNRSVGCSPHSSFDTLSMKQATG